MEKEIKITPPEGYEIDRENSTFDCIRFKPSIMQPNRVAGYATYTGEAKPIARMRNPYKHCLYATEKQAESAIAMAQISQIIANDPRFGGPVTDEEWKSDTLKYVIIRVKDVECLDTFIHAYAFLAFHSPEERSLFFKENSDLVHKYLMI